MKPKIVETYAIKERRFYQLYFDLLNVGLDKKKKLTNQEIELASIICAKELKYFLDKQREGEGKSKKHVLAEEMGVKVHAVYNLIRSLQRKEVLVADQDDFINLNHAINTVRKEIKTNIENDKPFSFEYVFDITIQS